MTGSKPTRAMLGIVAVATLAAAGADRAAAHQGHSHAVRPQAANPVPAPWPFTVGGPFSLIDHDGRPRSDKDFRGAFMLVFFGYAGCEGICPIGLPRMVAAIDALGGQAKLVQPVFITVDPKRDAPGALGKFVRKFHPRLIGLTGPAEALQAVAKAYRAEARVIGRFPDGSPIISHGTYIYLVGPDGGVVTLFPPVMDIAAMAAAIRRYLPAQAPLK